MGLHDEFQKLTKGMFEDMDKVEIGNAIFDEPRQFMILFNDGSHALGISTNVSRLAAKAQIIGDAIDATVVALFDGQTLYAIDWDKNAE